MALPGSLIKRKRVSSSTNIEHYFLKAQLGLPSINSSLKSVNTHHECLKMPVDVDPPSLPGRDSTWLIDVLDQWRSSPISRIPSLHDVGKAIIRKLLSYSPLPIPTDGSLIKILGPPNRDSIPPSMRLVMKDLLQPGQHNVCDFIGRSPEIGVTGEDVVSSLLLSSTLVDMNSPDRRLYGALDIPMTKTGLSQCKYKASEYTDSAEYLVSDKIWTTAFTPPGAITHVHMDHYGRHQ